MFDSDIISNRVNRRRRYVNDLILLAACLLISGIAVLIIRVTAVNGSYIEICVLNDNDVEEYASYPLSDEGYVIIAEVGNGSYSITYESEYDSSVDASNVVHIYDGKADMIYADCPDLICVHTKPVSRIGESIICLPHGVTVTVAGDTADADSDKYDAVTW